MCLILTPADLINRLLEKQMGKITELLTFHTHEWSTPSFFYFVAVHFVEIIAESRVDYFVNREILSDHQKLF